METYAKEQYTIYNTFVGLSLKKLQLKVAWSPLSTNEIQRKNIKGVKCMTFTIDKVLILNRVDLRQSKMIGPYANTKQLIGILFTIP